MKQFYLSFILFLITGMFVIGQTAIVDDFDPAIDMSNWSVISGIASTNCGSVSGNALYFDTAGVREAVSVPLNTNGGGVMTFYLKLSSGMAPCEAVDAGEDVVLEYSIDLGTTWININTYTDTSGIYDTFALVVEAIPLSAQTGSTLFRWRQLMHSGSCCDHWALDDINVNSGAIPPGPYSTITGHVFYDNTSDCILDPGETPIPNVLVKATPGPFYGVTQADGSYLLYVADTGTYQVELLSTPYSILVQNVCPVLPNYWSVQVDSLMDTVYNVNFAREVIAWCPLMSVDIGTPFIRPCSSSIVYVSWVNSGTDTAFAADTYVEIDLGDSIVADSASIPWSLPQTGSVYSFDLGDVPPGGSGSLYIHVTAACGLTAGATECIDAHIYPDTLCLPIDTNWDGSSVSVDATCIGDTVIRFVIYNNGANMTASSNYNIYENNVVVFTDTFILNGGDSLVSLWPSGTPTFMLSVDQSPGHPGSSQPRVFVEQCTSGTAGNPNFGFINQLPQDDLDPFVAVDCIVVSAAYDPNDKAVLPEGVQEENYITENEDLNYRIRFQNTGNDTAFKIVIIDTIASSLDITTIQPGASSHPYTWNVSLGGIVEFTFDNVLLPDSNTNEPESHGFVKFSIRQMPNNPLGTVIRNDAGIYFDQNPVVMTNEVFNTVYNCNSAYINTVMDPALQLPSVMDQCGDELTIGPGGTGGFHSYDWSNGGNGPNTIVNASGTYYLTVMDSLNCFMTDSIEVTLSPAPPVDLGPDIFSCDPVPLNAPAGYPGYLWSTNDIIPSITASTSGSYYVTVTDSDFCLGSDTINVTIHPEPFVDLGPDITICEAEVIADAGPDFVNYDWSNGATTQTTTITSSTTLSVTVTDSNGCMSLDEVIYNFDTKPQTNFTYLATELNVQFTDQSVNNDYRSWNFGDGSPVDISPDPMHAYSSAGTYAVSLITENVCGFDTMVQEITMAIDGTVSVGPFGEVKLYPNPVKGILFLETNGVAVEWVRLNNLLGQEVLRLITSNKSSRIEIDMEMLPVGVYFLELHSGEQNSVVKVVRD